MLLHRSKPIWFWEHTQVQTKELVRNFMGHIGNFMVQVENPRGQVGNPI